MYKVVGGLFMMVNYVQKCFGLLIINGLDDDKLNFVLNMMWDKEKSGEKEIEE